MAHVIEIINVADIIGMPEGAYCCRITSVTDDIIRAKITTDPHRPMPDHTCCLLHVSKAPGMTELHVNAIPGIMTGGYWRQVER